MKKNFNQPEMTVLHIGKEIATDIIVSSQALQGGSEAIYAPDRMGNDWDAGY